MPVRHTNDTKALCAGLPGGQGAFYFVGEKVPGCGNPAYLVGLPQWEGVAHTVTYTQ